MTINEYNFMKITMFTEKFLLPKDIAAVTCWGSFTSSLNPKNYLDDELQTKTRWTFFRVKLVFECDFEIFWSLCPWDPWTFGLLDLFPPPLPPHTSSYLLLSLPPTLSLWYGLVWGVG